MATAHLIVSGLLRRDGSILLVREQGPDDPEPNWMLPGGRVEGGESVLDALRRELRDETDVAWYDPRHLRRHLSGEAEGGATYAVEWR